MSSSGSSDHDRAALDDRLARLSAALRSLPATGGNPAAAASPEHPWYVQTRGVAVGNLTVALALVAVAIATGHPGWAIPAALIGFFAVANLLGIFEGSRPRSGTRNPGRAHIGPGAEIAEDAVIEPGASVEMGATVRSKAVVKRGAVVRMGATVMADAVIEDEAVVSWGADVCAGAIVERGAVIGAGATVHARTRVPARTRLAPGADWTAARAGAAGASPVGADPGRSARTTVSGQASGAEDPRRKRLHAACDRIDAELRQLSPQLREALGVSGQTGASLRAMCDGVLARERMLRTEAAPETLALLEQEKAELERKIAATDDDAIRRSLRKAVEAISDQQRQRGLFLKGADRLDAELTRLQWTLEGMGTQLVRLRTAGAEVRPPEQELLGAFSQLYEEIGAIAEGLEEVARIDPSGATVEPISDAGGESRDSSGARHRVRS